MLTDQDKTDLRKLDAAATKAEIKAQIHRAHVAVNAGTLDAASVNDALDRLTVLTKVDEDEPEPAKPAEKPSIFASQPAPQQPASAGA